MRKVPQTLALKSTIVDSVLRNMPGSKVASGVPFAAVRRDVDARELAKRVTRETMDKIRVER
jgi:hypothetical protein